MQFYGSLDTFKREIAMFDVPELRDSLLPFVMACENSDGRASGPSGFVYPPFVIAERGESLNEWVSRSAPDLATTIFVLLHVAERLQRLHQAGIVHRYHQAAVAVLLLYTRLRWLACPVANGDCS